MKQLSIAIPTYNREETLLDTVNYLLKQMILPAEILIIDQTIRHKPGVESILAEWDTAGSIRWIRLPQPSIPKAMNEALIRARSEILLFLDDDIIPSPGL